MSKPNHRLPNQKEAMASDTVIMWFRQDLRIEDNPALLHATEQGRVLPLFILDEDQDWPLGGASRWWLHHSLHALNESLGGRLWILRGDAAQLLPEFAEAQGASHVIWNRCYEPWRTRRDSGINKQLLESGICASSFNGSLIWEPWENLKKDGTPYKVFTPFYKHAIAKSPPAAPLPKSSSQFDSVICNQDDCRIDALGLAPKINWYEQIASTWHPGEAGAQAALQNFIDNGLHDYRAGRDFPARNSISRLSPHLHFGEVSPRQAASLISRAGDIEADEEQATHFIRELAWREFSYYSLYHFPQISQQNMKPQFDGFPWRKDPEKLRLWQQGQTGYPLVDAGMRELWQTGYMHNRVRMIVASFLVKNLMIHWLEGARWFWDCLLDADLANNSCSWQWVAGSGADAAPYFRIFNPVTQSMKFDPQARYIRKYVPELSGLSDKAIHDPSSLPESVLKEAGVVLGGNYPNAIVDLKSSRTRALDAYQTLRDEQ